MTDDRRTQILDAAIRLLEREGASAFKQTRIAEEAGLEQGHLTYYFPKRHDLVEGVFERFAARSREELLRAVARSNGSPRVDLFRVVAAMIRDHRRTRVLLSLVLAGGPDPDLAEKAAAFVRGQRKAFAAILGRPEGDLDAEVALAALRGIAVEQMLLQGRDERLTARVERIEAWLDATPGEPPPEATGD